MPKKEIKRSPDGSWGATTTELPSEKEQKKQVKTSEKALTADSPTKTKKPSKEK